MVNLTHTVQSDHFKPVIVKVRNTDHLVKFQCSGEKTLGLGNHVSATSVLTNLRAVEGYQAQDNHPAP